MAIFYSNSLSSFLTADKALQSCTSCSKITTAITKSKWQTHSCSYTHRYFYEKPNQNNSSVFVHFPVVLFQLFGVLFISQVEGSVPEIGYSVFFYPNNLHIYLWPQLSLVMCEFISRKCLQRRRRGQRPSVHRRNNDMAHSTYSKVIAQGATREPPLTTAIASGQETPIKVLFISYFHIYPVPNQVGTDLKGAAIYSCLCISNMSNSEKSVL